MVLSLSPGEYIALYQSQRAIMKQKHHEKEQYINMLAQDKEEMKVLQRFGLLGKYYIDAPLFMSPNHY